MKVSLLPEDWKSWSDERLETELRSLRAMRGQLASSSRDSMQMVTAESLRAEAELVQLFKRLEVEEKLANAKERHAAAAERIAAAERQVNEARIQRKNFPAGPAQEPAGERKQGRPRNPDIALRDGILKTSVRSVGELKDPKVLQSLFTRFDQEGIPVPPGRTRLLQSQKWIDLLKPSQRGDLSRVVERLRRNYYRQYDEN